MGRYLFKRTIYTAITLLLISFLAFWLSTLSPGDPVLQVLKYDPFADQMVTPEQARREYRQKAREMHMDRPAFYLSYTSAAFPDTLHLISLEHRRKTLKSLVQQYGNWEQVERYYRSIEYFEAAMPGQLKVASLENRRIELRRAVGRLYGAEETTSINSAFSTIEEQLKLLTQEDTAGAGSWREARQGLRQLQEARAAMVDKATPLRSYIPAVRWNGFDNQYHHWVTGFFRGDFGISLVTGQPAFKKIVEAAGWTLLMNLLALLLAYGLAIPLGVWSAVHKNSWKERTVNLWLFLMYSLPAFWVGTLLVIFLTTPEYGRWLDIFPGPGLRSEPPGAPFWVQVSDIGAHLILPVFCLAYPAWAFITRQVRGSVLATLEQDYIRTARAKGLTEKATIWKHAFRNSLFPLITMVASLFPGLLAGSVLIEFIFNIPGMGRLTYQAIVTSDWPVLFSILFLASLLTIIGNLVADLLYALADPRVSFSQIN